jgi:hypothetical protein
VSGRRGLSRRQALGLLAGGAVALGAGGVTLLRREGDDGPAPTDPEGLRDALVTIGARYLALHPEDAALADLLAALGDSADDLVAAPGAALRARQDAIAAEHVDGVTVDLDGWVLARTECRIAAVVALA